MVDGKKQMIYMYEAIRRPKENSNMDGLRCVRAVKYDNTTEDEVIAQLKLKIASTAGRWRIYRLVNARDPVKAKLELIETLTKQLVYPLSVSDKNPEALWRDILMQPRNKVERLFLIDVNTLDYGCVSQILADARITVQYVTHTPNGYHIVAEPFDPRFIEPLSEFASIKKDALVYITTIDVAEPFRINTNEQRTPQF
jgi:hypothetical protein